MKLYTECHWDGWDRIVDIYTERCDLLPECINDDSTYKIIILEKGCLEISESGKTIEVKVLENGFEYEGKAFKSISRVAMTIVKRPISGYVFFGLTK